MFFFNLKFGKYPKTPVKLSLLNGELNNGIQLIYMGYKFLKPNISFIELTPVTVDSDKRHCTF
jgi:hypothetical protein